MGKALLINPSYFRTYGSNEGGIAFPVFPVLSLASLAGAVKARGHEVRIVDLSYRAYDPDLIKAIIAEESPDVIGITATTPLMNQMRDISFLVKDVAPHITTIAGGAHPSSMPREAMAESAIDLIVTGEGDFVIADLLDGRPLSEIPGLYWRDGDRIVANPPGPLLEDLDLLPMPAWEDYPTECNERVTRLIARDRPVTMAEFSRGCIYRCDFCASKNTMGKGYRKKSPERCADEFERLSELGFREVVLTDDIFTSDNEWAADVCRALIARNTGISWNCANGIRVDAANPELFELMKQAGCYRVFFGFESGNDEVLRSFGKGGRATLDQGIEAVEMAHEAGLEPNGFFMVGLSGDTAESMQDTIDYARRVRLDSMKCGICVPYPGTPMFKSLQREGRIKTFDWDAYTVYNQADNIFDHPDLEWDVVKHYFRKFYRHAYFTNLRYLARRFRFMVRHNEIFFNLFYTLKFGKIIWGRPIKGSEIEDNYAYEHLWRPLDLKPGQEIEDYAVPRARGAKVTISAR